MLEKLQVISKNLQSKCTLSPSERFSDVVFDRLRKVPDGAGVLLHRTVHGRDQLLFILVEYEAPFVVGLQIDEVLCISESSRVGPIIRASNFGNNSLYLGK